MLEAESPRAARDHLRAEGLTPTAVAAARRATDALPSARLPAPLVALTTRQLATLVQSGMPLDQALAAVAEQADDARAAKNRRRRAHARRLRRSAAAALARYPRTFSPLYRGLVGAGAETGRLADVLARLADYLEAREALRQKVVLALIYPAIVTVIAFAVIAVLLAYVVPQVVSVYQQSRQTLPWLTQALIATSAFFPRDRMAVAGAGRRRGRGVRAGQPAAVISRALACVAVARAGRGQARAKPRLGALREHARHPRGQRRAAAALARCRLRCRAHDSAAARGAGRAPRWSAKASRCRAR